ncbi:hypothetical protein ACIO8G_29535 [Streptomyces sp. NPDC087219]|uniref:hypothetical protein n=1 Tax=Streptomyces sp. NPDC087219 TaxID=3365770 RepID=UPI00382B8C26
MPLEFARRAPAADARRVLVEVSDPEGTARVGEQVLDRVPDGEGPGLAAQRVEDLHLAAVGVGAAGAGRGDDEPAVRQPVQVREPGPQGAQLGDLDAAVVPHGDAAIFADDRGCRKEFRRAALQTAADVALIER